MNFKEFPILLIICDEISLSQPSYAFIKALENADIKFYLICNFSTIEFKGKDNIIVINESANLNNKLAKLSIILWKKDLKFKSFEKRAIESINNFDNFDWVMSFSTGGSYQPLSIAYKTAKLKNKPLYIHTVDPLPSIPAWGEKTIYRNSIIKMIKPYFDYASAFSANNEKMLEYQSNLVKFKGKTTTIPIVINDNFTHLETANNDPIFLYSGSFYGKRTPDVLLKNFKEFLSLYPNAILKIAGINNINLDDWGLNDIEKKQIKLVGFVNDLNKLYAESNVLIDLDANVKNDVFISGKLIKYLNISKIILSITPKNSPTSLWLKNISGSSVCCDYESTKMVKHFKLAYELSKSMNTESIYDDRKAFLQQFKPDSIIKKTEQLLRI